MAVLTYGSVVIQVQKTHDVSAEDVYDSTGLDYLWTRYTLDVVGLINFAATSYTTQQGNAVPQVAPVAAGNPPFLTLQAIRDTLSLPRQPLTYADESGNVLIQSPGFALAPAAGFAPGQGILRNFVQPPQLLDCDCDGGPKPLRPPQILSVHGQGKSVIVRFVVSTTVNESPFWVAQGGLTSIGHAAPKPPVILSNRWTATEAIDKHAFSTRTFSGRAVFRADLLRDILVRPDSGVSPRLAVPDDFRSYWANFFVPAGFQRQQVVVEQEPDGFAVRYRVTDVQLPVTLTDQRACTVEAVYVRGTTRRGMEDLTTAAARGASDLAIDIFKGTSFDPAYTAAQKAAAMLRYTRTLADLALDALPTSTDHFIITATGQPNSTKLDLVRVCYKVWFNYFNRNDFFWCGTSMTLTLDMMGKWVQLDVALKRGPVRTSVLSGPSGLIDYRTIVNADDGIPGVTSSTPGNQPVLPNDGNTRGTALEMLVAQSLMLPYNEAPAPGPHSNAGQGLTPP